MLGNALLCSTPTLPYPTLLFMPMIIVMLSLLQHVPQQVTPFDPISHPFLKQAPSYHTQHYLIICIVNAYFDEQVMVALSPECVYRTEEWWVYELCFNR